MTFSELLSISGAVLLSLGGGAAIVGVLSHWLGGIWAGRIMENERAALTREQELLVRRRNVYSKLALTMRVFLAGPTKITLEQKSDFLAAYDEAALWASEEVVAEIATFLDMQIQHATTPGSVTQTALRAKFVHCITVMRRDCGFPDSDYRHHVASF